MWSWGGGGRQCLVLRGTRVPPSCKWGGTEIGPLLAQIGRRGPTGARRGLPTAEGASSNICSGVYHPNHYKLSIHSRSLLELGGSTPASTAVVLPVHCFGRRLTSLSSIMVVIWHCWTTMIMRLGFCQLNDQTNENSLKFNIKSIKCT